MCTKIKVQVVCKVTAEEESREAFPIGQPYELPTWLKKRIRVYKAKVLDWMKQQPNPYDQVYTTGDIRKILGLRSFCDYREVVRRTMKEPVAEGKVTATKINGRWHWRLAEGS